MRLKVAYEYPDKSTPTRTNIQKKIHMHNSTRDYANKNKPYDRNDHKVYF